MKEDIKEEWISLADEIDEFLKEYGKKDASDSDEWSSPDAALMEMFGEKIRIGKKPEHGIWSDFGSGGYKQWMDKSVRARHDAIIQRASQIVQG
jgi:hypothetical protein